MKSVRPLAYLALLLTSSLAFSLLPAAKAAVTRGPYLQIGTPDSITLRWRTDTASDSAVRYGTSPGNLNLSTTDPAVTTEHIVQISGLQSGTRYYYQFGDSGTWFATDPDDFFVTAPPAGLAVPTRIWAIGDSGTADANARAVRDAYTTFTGSRHTDVWLMLGDNAYDSGTDNQYQNAVFNTYPTLLQNTTLWSTRGNHESDGGGSGSTYYNIFTLPAGGEAGGLASGTEAYYSFDHANVHFICLDSQGSSRSTTGPMALWLQNDLAATLQDWIIAFWHHPAYTKGSHDSDLEGQLIDMRANFLPFLEAGGVDLVLSGHSHSYERSFLLDGHYGTSGTLTAGMVLDGGSGREDDTGAYQKASIGPASNEGAVYITAGSSGKLGGGSLNHSAMFISLNNLGSVVMDVDGNRMDVKFLRENGAIDDSFTMVKAGPTVPAAPQNLVAAPGNGQVTLDWDVSFGAIDYNLKRATVSGGPYTVVATPASNSHVDSTVVNGTTYYYVVSANNTVGESANATEVDVTPSDNVQDFANSDIPIAGTVAGNFIDTHFADDIYEVITERQSGGKPANRHSYLEHKWTVNVSGGSTVTLFLQAYQSTSPDGDNFDFAWSDDDSTYTPMFTVNNTTDDGSYRSFNLPSTLSGQIFIRVTDTDQTSGNRDLDSVFVDEMFIRSQFAGGDNPPSTPSGLNATAGDSEVQLSWTPSSGADTYNVKRSTTSTGPYTTIATLSASTHTDSGLINGTTYYYVVSAVNAFGESGDSPEVAATPDVPSIPQPPSNLSATKKGKGKIALAWTQSASPGITANTIYRSIAGGPFEFLISIAPAVEYQDTGLTANVEYCYLVTATNSEGESDLPPQEACATPR